MWIVRLFITAALIFVFMLFFADSGERAKSQAMLIGSVTAVIAAMLLLIQFLDDPYGGELGSLEPVAMERTLGIMRQEEARRGKRARCRVTQMASGDRRSHRNQ